MNYIKFQIYDSKAEAFILPYYAPTSAMGQRQFHQAANDPKTSYYKYPGDYTLFEVATWDDYTGEETPLTPFINHGLALMQQNSPASQVRNAEDAKSTMSNSEYVAWKDKQKNNNQSSSNPTLPPIDTVGYLRKEYDSHDYDADKALKHPELARQTRNEIKESS